MTRYSALARSGQKARRIEKETVVGPGIFGVESARFPLTGRLFELRRSDEWQVPRHKSEWRCVMASINPTQGLSGPASVVSKASGLYIGMAVVFIIPVSYTHLDVYKRQDKKRSPDILIYFGITG